ncbi:alpha/beta fold hydrolase [Pararhizobium mangrovi]|uniref:Alpha/beta hydrolase n=1 Tax=Pararhizobium mangrovi TaxID=2590452 RepID=A0A506U7U4_9HYPH|nr:alpha/beta hydrolase [Pararhizobium mangrovi]TPW29950.1 alpha/beta hydrolase [Pararhizobium mangrovi]
MDATLYATAGNPIPETARAGRFEGVDGTSLRYALFSHGGQNPCGTVVLLHGRNECIEKYFETVRDLDALGFAVATFDWRGQGDSGRLVNGRSEGHVRRFSDYVGDLRSFLETIVEPWAPRPLYLIGHSTGGLIALAAAPELGGTIERMVLCAPFVALARRRSAARRLAALLRLANLAGFGTRAVGTRPVAPPFEGNGLTSDRARFERNRAIVTQHSGLALGRPTVRWLAETMGAMDTVNQQAFLTRISVPTLVLAATRDTIVPATALEAMDERFRAGHLMAIDGARHEILQERDLYRAQALAAIETFFAGKATSDRPSMLHAAETDAD